MLTKVLTSAAVWTGLGLASGLYYREFTRDREIVGFTQLSVAHTHALALGTLVLLIVLALAKLFSLDAKGLAIFLGVYQAGLGITWLMLIIKGTLQVLGSPAAESAALAGIAGLGHMTLTGALVWLFVLLFRAVKASDAVVA